MFRTDYQMGAAHRLGKDGSLATKDISLGMVIIIRREFRTDDLPRSGLKSAVLVMPDESGAPRCSPLRSFTAKSIESGGMGTVCSESKKAVANLATA